MIQEILDEVLDTSLQPDTNPRYTIKDNNGRIINDNVQIDFKTPVVQNPTPLNRATLSNIQGDLYTQDRYNIPQVTNGVLILNLPLTMYEVGKIVRIRAPQTLTDSYININNLGQVLVEGTINANNFYNLVYDGIKFLVEKTLVGVTSDTILATVSGTYELNPDVTYDVVAIGGGGGSWLDWDGYDAKSGGSGGYIKGSISNTSSINVTIGAGGDNVISYRPLNVKAGDGGTTTVGTLIAYGGTGASMSGTSTGGSYSGDGVGQNGSDGVINHTNSYSYVNGPEPTGWNIIGTIGGKYGAGGQIKYYSLRDEHEEIYKGQDGIVAFIPQV